jgi:TonB-linked SusC/RagA family outer membrane protein
MKQVNLRISRTILPLLLGLFMSMGVYAQQITVKGHVTDATNEPVIGANVIEKGNPKNGVITDIDGNFVLRTAKNAVITISFVGYKTLDVKAAPTLTAVMQEDSKVLNDVVVIGYGSVKKTDATGSVTAIKPDAFNHGLNTNPQDMMQGKIAGVNVITNGGVPGSGATIRIRGGSSLNASNDPLIVIDGLAMDNYGVQGLANPLSMVNPGDIESFTVLKDASATAIYGSRASNGVIIITTKKGKAGSKPTVTYNGNVSMSTKKKTLDVMDGPSYVNFITNLYGADSDAYKALGWYDNSGVQHIENTDWQDQIYRIAVSTDHNVTVSGGLKNMPYRVSAGYTYQDGIVKTSNFQRYTASFTVAPSLLNDHLKFNINGKGMYATNRYADGGAIGAAVYMDPTKPVKASNDIYNNFFGGYTQWYQASYVAGSVNTYDDPTWLYTSNSNATSNPVALLRQKLDKATSKTLLGNVEMDYKVHGFEDLHFHVNGGMDLSTGRQTTSISPYSKTNNYYGSEGWNTKDTYNLSFSAYAQYLKDFAKIHHIDIMAGYEWQHFHESTDYYSCGYYRSTNTSNANAVYNAPSTETKYKTENFLVSFFGRLNYTLLDRYLFTFTLRDDGSSRFSKDNRWGLFPSAALAWKIKEESFLKDVDAVTDMKLRLGYGITGQQEGIGDYKYLALYQANHSHAYYPIGVNSDGSTYRPIEYNPDLKWEKTTTYNAGIDLGFFDNRFTLSADYYYRKTKDLINDIYVSAGSNFKNKLISNIGSLHNTGFEISSVVKPVQTPTLRWEIGANFTYNKNKVDKLLGSNDDTYFVETGGISAGTGGDIQAHAVGQSTSTFHVYQQVYDKYGKPIANTFVDRNGDGVINSSDRYYYKKPAADVLMGLTSKLLYKGWDFSFSLRASINNYVYNDTQAGSSNVGAAAIFYGSQYLSNRPWTSVNRGWSTVNTEQYYSDYFVQNASFLKCDNITLGYSFNRLFGYNITGRLYGTVQNVFTITHYKGIDPEVSGGIDNNLYPRPMVSLLGLSLNF